MVQILRSLLLSQNNVNHLHAVFRFSKAIRVAGIYSRSKLLRHKNWNLCRCSIFHILVYKVINCVLSHERITEKLSSGQLSILFFLSGVGGGGHKLGINLGEYIHTFIGIKIIIL